MKWVWILDTSKPIHLDLQKGLLARQLKIAGTLPIILHIRGSVTDTDGENIYNECRRFLIKENVDKNQHIQLHSFSGSERQIEKWSQSFPLVFFSISGLVGKFSEIQKKGLKSIPLDRILFETDSPYLSLSGGKNQPSNLIEVIKMVSEIRGESVGKLCFFNRKNSRVMFNL